jgi:hypothetical protein
MMVMRLAAAAHARAATLVLLQLNMCTRLGGTDLFLVTWLDVYACWLPRDHLLLLLQVIDSRSLSSQITKFFRQSKANVCFSSTCL